MSPYQDLEKMNQNDSELVILLPLLWVVEIMTQTGSVLEMCSISLQEARTQSSSVSKGF